MTVLTNRLNTESGCQLVREGGAMTDSEKERFGASQMVRYVSGINRPIYPIAFIKYKTAIGISAAVCCFSPTGRKKIHDNLEMDTTLFAYLREHPPKGHSLEYADLIAGFPCCLPRRASAPLAANVSCSRTASCVT